MKTFLLSMIMLLTASMASAESYIISGQTMDETSSAAVPMVTVRLMKVDSTFISGMSTSTDGVFKLDAKKAGKYILKFSCIGYYPVFKNITLTKESPKAEIGKIMLKANDILLSAAKVKARLAKVEMHKDTFIYNVAAYKVPEGATLEALIDKLPGAVVDDDGGVTINGKTVAEIRVDGKDFFKGDTKVAMKNMPISLINRVKAYDMQSDYTQQTGIDDGNEKTVLDLEMKKKLKSTLFSNIDLAYGSHDRYSTNAFVNRFTDNTRITAFGSMNNVGDRRFRGGGPGFRQGGNGLNANKNFGLDGFWNNGKKEKEAGFLELGGNVRMSHSSSDTHSRSNSENFLNSGSTKSFNNSNSQRYGHNSNINAELNLRWNPDTLTTLRVRPSFSHSESNSNSQSRSATFNSNPYEYAESPLDSMFNNGGSAINASPTLAAICVNRNMRESMSSGNNNNAALNFTLSRRLSNSGRNISLDGSMNYGKSNSKSFSISQINYFQRTTGNLDYTNQYTNSPSKNWSYNTRLSYAEPIIAKKLFMEASYNFNYSYSDSDRSLYQMGDSLESWGYGYNHLFGSLPSEDSLRMALDVFNSQYATYRDYIHNTRIGFRYVTEDLNLSIGVRVQPQHTELDYTKNGRNMLTSRNICNVSPNARLRWNLDKFSRLEFRYHGSSSQPSMTDLLDVVDNSDPLHISMGNPNLKPSWNNSLNMHYNTYQQLHHRSFAGDISWNKTQNSISNAVVYDAETGVRTSRPENINGNWNTNGWFMFNTGIGRDNEVFLGNDVNAGYSNHVGYVSVNNTNSEKNTVKSLNLGDRLRTSYRSDYFEVGLNGSINYSHSRSELQKQNNMDTYTFAYGANFQWNTTWNMSISTDMAMNSRRGFNDHSMNTNELIWNAQISQSFLDQNAATLSIQFYDILHRQSNISRTINAMSRSDNWTNGINSYIMVHFIYKMNLFGGIGGKIRVRSNRENRRNGDGERPQGMGGERGNRMGDNARM